MKGTRHQLRLRLLRRIRRSMDTVVAEPVQFTTISGYRIAATLTLPSTSGVLPGAVLCPDRDHGLRNFFEDEPIRPEEVAGLGCAVLTFDPPGRGESWGPEDFGGPEHHDAVASAVRWLRAHPRVRGSGVGLVGLGLGCSMAVGAARILSASGTPAAWLLDWEGPCDRHDITQGGTDKIPSMGRKITDDAYWVPRDPTHHVAHIQCPYWRLQADPDHALSDAHRHASAMMEAAGPLQWVRLNFHTAGQMPLRPAWISGGRLAANQSLLRAIGELSRGR